MDYGAHFQRLCRHNATQHVVENNDTLQISSLT